MSENNLNQNTSMAQEATVFETMTDKQMLLEILENSRKTKNYMKWQLYITVALVVLPLLAALVIIPMVLSSFNNIYGAGGVLQ
jgi:hypothetical protein